ncbi:hypothetical protein KSF_015400 [Reticulibacter mediterranei]|uniref:Uncharacterized protein n=1 Tax=Reticulibacter mediterranei TaxID=2778369 RepID=A0A8J3MZ40_9CHLR|nr:hypothetical protein [Reticulibacter mediterranei]GHO91492.1 hypothetical protein KSF_015400 [Reticulibacter mediterranei]
MGIYLGQLPAAEIARFKAELAETIIANFCYPRFFDPRTQSLRMRPVDRAKRQEVWLYLSSVDFTAWSRVDLMSPDFQHQIERLFILFVQRNRSFFGQQGRKRMFDIRTLISAQAGSVAQGLRNHLSGQKQGHPPFGSPRPVISWSAALVGGRSELTWEQIAASTMMLQQQMQEIRGEARPANAANGASRRTLRPQSPTGTENEASAQPASAVPSSSQQIVRSGPLPATSPSGPLVGSRNVAASVPPASLPAASASSSVLLRTSGPLVPPASAPTSPVPPTPPARKSEPLAAPPAPLTPTPATRKSEPLVAQAASTLDLQTTSELPRAKSAVEAEKTRTQPPPASTAPAVQQPTAPQPAQARTMPSPAPAPSVASGQRDGSIMSVGEDDLAIFEQMRHQLVVWLRVEAITAGLEIAGQSPSQLLELLRQHGRLDETRLQVVSTLLNLSNQVIKTGLVSLIDYKQALMFHLMHTRR